MYKSQLQQIDPYDWVLWSILWNEQAISEWRLFQSKSYTNKTRWITQVFIKTHHFLTSFSRRPCSPVQSRCRRCSDRGAPPRTYSSTWARTYRSSSARPHRQSAPDTGIPGAKSWRSPSNRDNIPPITQKTPGERLILIERARMIQMKAWLRLLKPFAPQNAV